MGERCPWCGGAAGLQTDRVDEAASFYWRCNDYENCGASGPWRPTRDEAVATMKRVCPHPCDCLAVASLTEQAGAACARADSAEAKLARAEEQIRAIAAKECTMCPFLGRGDPCVDESAARLAEVTAAVEWWEAHEELREVKLSSDGEVWCAQALYANGEWRVMYGPTRIDAIVALWKQVKG